MPARRSTTRTTKKSGGAAGRKAGVSGDRPTMRARTAAGRGAGLTEYNAKRHFNITAEPTGKAKKSATGRSFVIQKHDASRLHYDFRLEHNGVLLSWAVPKGPSLDPAERSLAVQVEDHPVDYGTFEGTIPKGQYGGGTVLLWDRGTWEPLGDVDEALASGKLKFKLHGEKLRGGWTLVRMRGGKYGEDGKNWLLIKERDEEVVPHAKGDVRVDEPLSVKTGRDLDEIAAAKDNVWQSNRPEKTTAKSKIAKKAAAVKKQARTPAVTPPEPLPKKVVGVSSTDTGKRKSGASPAGSIDASSLKAATKADFPDTPFPQLATLVKEAPTGDEWVHEVKFDGYRILALSNKNKVQLLTRHGNDWSDRFTTIAGGVKALGKTPAVFDGEVVVLNEHGRSDFQALQNVLKGLKKRAQLIYFVFDLLYYDGHDLTRVPLLERKRLLKQVLASAGDDSPLRYSEHIQGHGGQVLAQACQNQLEGIISKRATSLYTPKRSKDWLKVKCGNRQEFVIGGYTDPGGSRMHFGSLLLGTYDAKGDLIFNGKVGTGFDSRLLASLLKQMKQHEAPLPAFKNPPRGYEAKGVHWLKPALVCEVQFSEWTSEGILRHPSFQGLREDKDPREVVRENPKIVLEEVDGTAKGVTDTLPARKPSATSPERSERASSRGSSRSAPGRRAGDHRPTSIERERAEETPRKAPSRTNAAQITTKPSKPPKLEEGPVAGVTLTNPQRVQYPESGVTKLELARYYESIADWVLPHMVRRPLSLVRCPAGREKHCFYQKHLSDMLPKSVHGVPIREKNGVEEYVAIENLTGLVGLVQLGVLEIHPWGSREDDVEHPDRVIIDLDPGPGVEWGEVVDGARLVRERLDDLGLESFVKTTGGKGLHVVFPIQRRTSWDDVKAFAKAIADNITRDHPDKYLAVMAKAKRTNKIFVDYLRNGRGATAIAPYSTRARENATVATPLSWEELSENTTPAMFNVRTVPPRLAKLKEDPWADIGKLRQSITAAAMSKVGLR
ncbi:MAG TPA: non-homologous end-joining DNA ligase [Phycisphaerales bacterium]|nr:non-homologous end-joining DNA ligase [Phycisphaerales bacterium]